MEIIEVTKQEDDLVLETDHLEPKVLGADRTRQLYTHAYGMHLNGYSEKEIASNCRILFNIDINDMDVYHIIGSIEFEMAIASRKAGFIHG